MPFEPGHVPSPATREGRRLTRIAEALADPRSRSRTGLRGVFRQSLSSFVARGRCGAVYQRIGVYRTPQAAAAAYQDWLLAPLAGDDSHQPERTDE